MKKQKTKINRQILITIVLIALIALIGFNFEKITGGVIKHSYPIVTAYRVDSNGKELPEQNVLTAGETVKVKVKVGDYCVAPEISFYFGGVTYAGEKKSAGPRIVTVTQKGSSRICKGDSYLINKDTFTVEYSTRPNWNGDYYARVYFWKDRSTKDYLNVYFKVKPKTNY